jgi:hypothetical protein
MADQYALMKSLLQDRPIAFHPAMARILGGIHEALFFQQIAYWSGKGADPDWIYKTSEEVREETTLNRYQQDKARATLKRLGVLREERRGLPARMYYQVQWPVVFRLLGAATQIVEGEQTRMSKVAKQDRPPSADQNADSGQTSKSTTESTKEDEIPDPKLPKTLEELEAWEQRMEERRRWAKGLERTAD